MNIILKKPVVSEKTMKQAKEGLYTFLVDKKARKQGIVQEIEDRFDVDVISIKTANYKGETRMQRGVRKYYTIPGSKRAVVQLKKGQKLTIFETEAHEASVEPQESEVKEKKSLLKGTKVKIEKESKKKKGEK